MITMLHYFALISIYEHYFLLKSKTTLQQKYNYNVVVSYSVGMQPMVKLGFNEKSHYGHISQHP